MQQADVPPVTTKIDSLSQQARESLILQRLQADEVGDARIIADLRELVGHYASWRNSLDKTPTASVHAAARDRVLSRIDTAISRMSGGCDLLESDSRAMKCFRLANRAMLIQMEMASRVKKAEKGGAPDCSPINAYDAAAHSSKSWRPFQLAFLLLVIRGLWLKEDPERDIVDLLWFPTGGGKTEAYLGAIAFEVLRRRLCDDKNELATAVIMRYTLRLLTQQQFQRSAHLICAMELIRRSNEELLGERPFRLGLWVGQKVSPNHLSAAWTVYESTLLNHIGETKNPFGLLRCPACGHVIVPEVFEELGAPGAGIRCSTSSFEFFCPQPSCEFHDRIPVQIVDEALYKEPPTVLLATIDKFAMMAWQEKASRFFGARKRTENRVAPPSLIVQDELHLISGPLGPIAGEYEAAIDVAISLRNGRPKIIASTATTRRSSDQGRGLYARKVQVFPPPGIDAGDSFFSAPEEDRPGRLYLGAMAQGHTPTFSNVLASAALLSAVGKLGLSPEIEDSWWTLVAYHNSRRELGRSLTLARDDIPARLAAVTKRGAPGARHQLEVRELSANIKGDDIPIVLAALSKPKTAGAAVDYVACTNMLSVGVDIDRLGLMLVLGQPKTASEYIQATSRVGRNEANLPGVVLTLYMPTKPRDRSHYELFRPFHEAFYRYVEPSSVTPFALPARERAFHASVLSVIRMASALSDNKAAERFDPQQQDIRELLDALYKRMEMADVSESIGISRKAEDIERWWLSLVRPGLRYSTGANSLNYSSLIKRFGDLSQPDAKQTLQSMRHVDVNLRVAVKGRPRDTTRSAGE